MASKTYTKPLPAGPVVRLVVSALLIVLVLVRGPQMRIPSIALVTLTLALIVIALEQVRRIWLARRRPPSETVDKHPLGLS